MKAELLYQQGKPPQARYFFKHALIQEAAYQTLTFPSAVGTLEFYQVRGELQTAQEVGEQLLKLAQSVQDPALLSAHRVLGDTLFWLEGLISARTPLEESITLYDSQPHCAPTFPDGYNLEVAGRSWIALVWWYLGYPNQALKRSQEGLALTQELRHPFSEAYAMDEALAVVHKTGQYYDEAELYRLKGELLLRNGPKGGQNVA